MQPLVSIWTITYNHEKYIRQCLEGIMMQKTDFPFEVIIGDDCSTDNTRQIIQEYVDKYPNIIKPIYQEKNVGGLRNAYEFCYPNLKGKYIGPCEGDDYWTDPNKLQKQIDFLEQHPEFVLCFHRVNILNNGQVKNQHNENKVILYDRKEIFHVHMATLSVVFRNCIESFPEEFFKTSYGDVFLFGMLSRHGHAADLGFVGGTYRKHGQGLYTRKKQIEQFRHNIRTRKLMRSSSVFNEEEKKELKKEIVRKKVIYMKNFLKKKEISNCLKILFT